MGMGKRRIKNLLIDRKFQLKITGLVVIVAAALLCILGYLYVSEMKAASELMQLNQTVKSLMQLGGDNSFDKELQNEIEKRDTVATVQLIVIALILVVVLAGLTIWITHKAAGPVYATKQMLIALSEGNWQGIRPFRKHDEFSYLAVEFQRAAEKLKTKTRKELQLAQKIVEHLEQGELDKAKEVAVELSDRLKAFLGEANK